MKEISEAVESVLNSAWFKHWSSSPFSRYAGIVVAKAVLDPTYDVKLRRTYGPGDGSVTKSEDFYLTNVYCKKRKKLFSDEDEWSVIKGHSSKVLVKTDSESVANYVSKNFAVSIGRSVAERLRLDLFDETKRE